VVATTSDPRLGAIRMAWWRERLEDLDKGVLPVGEPRLQAIQRQLIARSVSGLELSKLEDAWLPLLDAFPWGEQAAEGLRLRGRTLFGIGGRLLGGKPGDAQAAGALWSLVDGATHCSDGDSREYLCHAAREALKDVPKRMPGELRPLTVLAALSAYDLRPGGRLGRVGAAMAHRLRGTIRHS